jgi:BCCT family betaine/carnitine transporter
MQSSNEGLGEGLDRLIFFGSVAGIVSLCVPLALFPEQGGVILGRAFDFLTHKFGVMYVAGASLTFVFLLYLAFSRHGDIRLGGQRTRVFYRQLGGYVVLRGYRYQCPLLGRGGVGLLLSGATL